MKPTRREAIVLGRLDPDEIAALDFFRARTGPRWKFTLTDLWANGRVAEEANGDALQRVRNKIGASGLYTIRGTVLAEAAKSGGAA